MRDTNWTRRFGTGLALGVFLLAGCAPIEGRETAHQYTSDATISTKIRADLIKDQALKAFDIHVGTMQGTVQLSGFVDSPQQKTEATQIAESVEGVKEVQNDIIVRTR